MAKVAFCQDMMVEYMGFACMAAVLKEAGHTVEVFCDTLTSEKRFLAELAAFKPDIVGFSVLTAGLEWALRLGKRIKETTGALTIYGNVHAILCPEIIENDGVDIVCLGEGELCMRDLCDALDRREDFSCIEGLWVRRPEGIVRNPLRAELVDMDVMPFPDLTIYNKYAFFRRSAHLRVMTGRGCPYGCSFCANPLLREHYGGRRYLRKMSPGRAIDAIQFAISRHPIRVKGIIIIDEVLWVRNEWLREFLALYRDKIHLPFNANFRFGAIEERDIQLMGEAGADVMAVCVETGDERVRREILDKQVSNAHILEVTRWMHKHRVPVGCTAFFGLPGDTVEGLVGQLPFYRQAKPFYLWTTFFQPYPKLPISEREDVRQYLPQGRSFGATLHHAMYLDLPERDRLVRLKKIYFLCVKFPRISPLLVWLTRFRIPLLFDLLFTAHFTYYIFRVERTSLFQFLTHIKAVVVRPLFRRT